MALHASKVLRTECKQSNNPLAAFQAKIDIGQRASQTCIEPARLMKNFTPREHTRARDSAADREPQVHAAHGAARGRSIHRQLKGAPSFHRLARLPIQLLPPAIAPECRTLA